MSTMKRFAKYLLWIVLFWILSDILIYVGINSTYKNMEKRGMLPEGISVIQMQSTKVNGRMKIEITSEDLSGKYLKIDLYSASGNVLGTQYLEIGNVKTSKTLETYFQISDIKSYEITVVDEQGETTTGFMDTALTAMTIFVLVIKLLFV